MIRSVRCSRCCRLYARNQPRSRRKPPEHVENRSPNPAKARRSSSVVRSLRSSAAHQRSVYDATDARNAVHRRSSRTSRSRVYQVPSRALCSSSHGWIAANADFVDGTLEAGKTYCIAISQRMGARKAAKLGADGVILLGRGYGAQAPASDGGGAPVRSDADVERRRSASACRPRRSTPPGVAIHVIEEQGAGHGARGRRRRRLHALAGAASRDSVSSGPVITVVTIAITSSMVNSCRADQAGIEADLHHDQFHQAARVHQRAGREAVAPAVAGQARAGRAAGDLAERPPRPGSAPSRRGRRRRTRRRGVQPGQREEDRHQHARSPGTQALDQVAQQAVVARQAGAEQERAEHRMQAQPFGQPPRRRTAPIISAASIICDGSPVGAHAAQQPRIQRPQHAEHHAPPAPACRAWS